MSTTTDRSTIHELARFGPGAPTREPPSLPVARDYVRRLALGHYENFSVLSRLVPPDLRDDFAAIYAYCRWSDDLGDETGRDEAARSRSLELLGWWRGELVGCFRRSRGEGGPEPTHPVFVALAETARNRGLDEAPFHHLIDAFEQDQRVTCYRTWNEVLRYCTRSADPVGRIILALARSRRLGTRPDEAELTAMSDATCTALQLTNFWQDVRRDLIERDRVYLPSAETGFGPAELREWLDRGADPEVRVRFIRAVRPLVERTRELFDRGAPLPARLACDLSPVIWLFGAGGRSVLARVERIGCATLWSRPRLTKMRKASLFLRAAVGARIRDWGRRVAG